MNGCRLLLLGLSYKRNTADAESPSLAVAERLVALGAEVQACEPHVAAEFSLPGVTRVDLTAEEISAADVVVVLTDHGEFDWALVVGNASHVFDTRHWLPDDAGNVEYL